MGRQKISSSISVEMTISFSGSGHSKFPGEAARKSIWRSLLLGAPLTVLGSVLWQVDELKRSGDPASLTAPFSLISYYRPPQGWWFGVCQDRGGWEVEEWPSKCIVGLCPWITALTKCAHGKGVSPSITREWPFSAWEGRPAGKGVSPSITRASSPEAGLRSWGRVTTVTHPPPSSPTSLWQALFSLLWRHR